MAWLVLQRPWLIILYSATRARAAVVASLQPARELNDFGRFTAVLGLAAAGSQTILSKHEFDKAVLDLAKKAT